ncbi:hypothetical protein BDQ17DRAFT_1406070 [Cyathus striatus]|nr:hypothetical protein BDQ17DRAFT_1406070 [Cyathus striatus]
MDDITQFTQEHQYKAQFQLAMAVVIIYDHLTTIDREVQFIWKKKKSLPQLLFIINRYIGDAVFIYATIVTVVLSPAIQNVSSQYIFVQTIGLEIVVWSMQGIMLHRISVMYGHSRKILFLMLSVYFCEIVTMIIITGIALSRFYVESVIIPDVATIQLAIIPSIISATWAISVIMEALLLILALCAGFRYIVSRREIGRLRSERPSLAFVLIRDSILFPLIALIAYTTTAFGWKFFAHPGGQISEAFSGCNACVLGPRLILNLREAYYRPFTDEYDQAAKEVLLLELDDSSPAEL